MLHKFLRAGCIAALAAFVATPAFARNRIDVIKGHVVGPDNKPMAKVSVLAKTQSGEVLKSVITDENGNYRIAITNGDGSYDLTVRAIGYIAVKLRVSPMSESGTVVANATMNLLPESVLSQLAQSQTSVDWP
jgi:hypothetical protein